MESSSWPESTQSSRIKAIQELTKGQILYDKLREMSSRPEKIESDINSVNGVVVQILGMFYNTLSILDPSNLNGNLHNPTNDVRFPNVWDDQKLKDLSENIKITTSLKTKRGRYNRRKNVTTISKVTSALIDDGYAWRKYGQKVILNSKHQRNYYRCSHKYEQGCQATKQVQKIDGVPSKYKITYGGLHTCNNLQRAPQIIVEPSIPVDNSILISFKTNTLRENNNVDTCFQSIKHIPNEGFPSLGPTKHEREPNEGFPSLGPMKHERGQNEGFPSLGPMNHERVSAYDHHTPWDPIMGLSQVQPELTSLMTSALDFDDMVSSEVFSSMCHPHGIGDMSESHGYGDLLFDYVSDIM